jgi:hypothetical protein
MVAAKDQIVENELEIGIAVCYAILCGRRDGM